MIAIIRQQSSAFLSWWLVELLALLPTSWRQKIQVETNQLLLQIDSAGLSVKWVYDGKLTELGSFAIDEKGRTDWQQVKTQHVALVQAEVVLLLSLKQCLYRLILLPKQAASNLRQVMGFELDRYTPFQADQLYFDVRKNGLVSVNQADKIGVQLIAAPKVKLDQLLTQLDFFAIQPNAVSYGDDFKLPVEAEGLNLLPEDRRPQLDRLNTSIKYGLLGLLLIQLFILLTYSGWYAEREIASLQKQLASIQQQVHQVSELRSSTARLENQFSELMTRAKTRPYTLTVLKELNSLLPNDTWLTQLRLSSRQLQIEGYSGAATGLVKRLDDSALFESTRFSSPLAGSKTGQQAFKIMTALSKND